MAQAGKRVYVINQGAHDYTAAEYFGDIIYCTKGSVDRFDTSQMFRELLEALHDSQADDYILLTSLTTLCCVACSIMAAKHGQVNLLLFRGDAYVERTLYLKNIT